MLVMCFFFLSVRVPRGDRGVDWKRASGFKDERRSNSQEGQRGESDAHRGCLKVSYSTAAGGSTVTRQDRARNVSFRNGDRCRQLCDVTPWYTEGPQKDGSSVSASVCVCVCGHHICYLDNSSTPERSHRQRHGSFAPY